MAVHDLERARVEALARELASAFQRQPNGWLAAETAHLEDVERWRRAARRAGRLLGLHVRTGITIDGDRVWMVGYTDTPMTPAQRADVARRLGALFLGDDGRD
jgi:hypothetical protein